VGFEPNFNGDYLSADQLGMPLKHHQSVNECNRPYKNGGKLFGNRQFNGKKGPPMFCDVQNPYGFKNNRRLLTRDYKIKKKTELCSSWKSTGNCKYGISCAFAHGEHELQPKVHVPSMYKTKLCHQFHFQNYCPYGHRCQFIHSNKLGSLIQKKQTDEEELDLKQFISYKQMLKENKDCLMDRIRSSHNPYLNEFNLVYKNFNSRLSVFKNIT